MFSAATKFFDFLVAWLAQMKVTINKEVFDQVSLKHCWLASSKYDDTLAGVKQ